MLCQACDNDISEFGSVEGALISWQKLEKLDLTGNPLCHKSKYRDKLIVMSRTIGELAITALEGCCCIDVCTSTK